MGGNDLNRERGGKISGRKGRRSGEKTILGRKGRRSEEKRPTIKGGKRYGNREKLSWGKRG